MASAMHAAQAKLDVSAANLANVSSDGFRGRVARATLSDAGLLVSTTSDASVPPLRHTGRSLDISVTGSGSFRVRDVRGRDVTLRSASLEIDERGRLCDDRARIVRGIAGPIVASADAEVDSQGNVRDAGRIVGRIALAPGTSVQTGFLEGTSVDGMHEMVEILTAQRAFETAQKSLAALDDERQKDADDVARVKA